MFLELSRSNCQYRWLLINHLSMAMRFHSFHSSSGRDTSPFQMYHSIHGIGGQIQSCITTAPTQLLAIPITAFYGQRLTVSKTHHRSNKAISYSCLRNSLIMIILELSVMSWRILRLVYPICITIHIYVIDQISPYPYNTWNPVLSINLTIWSVVMSHLYPS